MTTTTVYEDVLDTLRAALLDRGIPAHEDNVIECVQERLVPQALADLPATTAQPLDAEALVQRFAEYEQYMVLMSHMREYIDDAEVVEDDFTPRDAQRVEDFVLALSIKMGIHASCNPPLPARA